MVEEKRMDEIAKKEEEKTSDDEAMMTPESYTQKGRVRRNAVSAEVVQEDDVKNYVKKVVEAGITSFDP